MPELSKIQARVCESNFAFQTKALSSNGRDYYDVVWTRNPAGFETEFGWNCTCEGFKYRQSCRHIKAAEQERCGWGAEAFAGSPQEANEDGTCPKCGGETRIVTIGV